MNSVTAIKRTFAVSILLFSLSASSATITIMNADGAGEGFNDQTPVAPIGGNSGTTLGEQRLNVFNYAASIWAERIDSPIEIRVEAQFDPLYCTPNSAVLGSAGTTTVHRDFAGAPLSSTWYPQALANSIAGTDLSPASPDLSSTFNSEIDNNSSCLTSINWYLGLDGNNNNDIDLADVVIHEIGHGLGFASYVDPQTGVKFLNYIDVFSYNLESHASGLTWDQMSNSQRALSAVDSGNLHFIGSNVVIAAQGHVPMYSPNPVDPGSSVSHFDVSMTPNELMEPFITDPPMHDVGLAYEVMLDLGWMDATQPGNEPLCGQPTFNRVTERAVFLWNDCADPQQWHARVTAGGVSSSYRGSVTSNQPFDSLTGFSIEASDSLPGDFSVPTAGPITYVLNVGGTGQDGFEFHYPVGANVCFDLASPDLPVYIGADRVEWTVPVNLTTFDGCAITLNTLSVSSVIVGEDAGTAEFTVNLSPAPGPGEQVDVDYMTANDTATAGSDYTQTSGTLTFLQGQSQLTVSVPIVDDTVSEGTEAFSLALSSTATNSVTATATILDNDGGSTPVCGQPNFDLTADTAVFLWNDCADPQQWHARMTAGGVPNSYRGSVTSNQPFNSLQGFSLEASDSLPADFSTPTAGPITYVLNVGGTGQDGFEFNFPASANVCFDLASPALPVYIGSSRVEVAAPVNLTTFSACEFTGNTLSVDSVIVGEDARAAVFAVNLSPAPGPGEQVNVDYTTADATAFSGSDYTLTSGTLTFLQGQSQLTVSVPIVDDTVSEGTEAFSLALSSAATNSVTATATILDNDGGSTPVCGQPNFDRVTERAVFLWNDCLDTQQWHARVTAGGVSTSYRGSVTSNQLFDSLTGFSIETSDSLPGDFTVPTAGPIAFTLNVGNSGQDGFEFHYPVGANVCFDLASPALPVYIGADRVEWTVPVNLTTFGACTP